MTYVLLGLLPGIAVIVLMCGVRFIGNDHVGIVEKRWSRKGSVKSGFIALNGEAGFQPQLLRGGVHWLTPFQYRVHVQPLVTIPQGKIGYVVARDGQPLKQNQALASNEKAFDFEDVAAFLSNGGQKGPQRRILRAGTYAVNLAQFSVITESSMWTLPLSKQDNADLLETGHAIADRGGFDPVVIRGVEDQMAS